MTEWDTQLHHNPKGYPTRQSRIVVPAPGDVVIASLVGTDKSYQVIRVGDELQIWAPGVTPVETTGTVYCKVTDDYVWRGCGGFDFYRESIVHNSFGGPAMGNHGADAALISELHRLKAAVRRHFNQRGDNRCHLDDLKLYRDVLGVGTDPFVCALPPEPDMLESCKRYIKQRGCPNGVVPLPGDMTIAQLTEYAAKLASENAVLKQLLQNVGHALCDNSNHGSGWWNDEAVMRQINAIEAATGYEFFEKERMEAMNLCKSCKMEDEVDAKFRCNMCNAARPETIPREPDGTIVLKDHDLNCVIVVTTPYITAPYEKPTLIQFEVYRVAVWDDEEPNYVVPDQNSDKTTTVRIAAAILLRGDIKWDGCSNVEYRPEQRFRFEHYCSRRSAMLPGLVMDKLYDLMAVLQEGEYDSDLK